MPPRAFRRTPYNTRFTPQGMPIPRRPERDAADDVGDVDQADRPAPKERQEPDDPQSER